MSRTDRVHSIESVSLPSLTLSSHPDTKCPTRANAPGTARIAMVSFVASAAVRERLKGSRDPGTRTAPGAV